MTQGCEAIHIQLTEILGEIFTPQENKMFWKEFLELVALVAYNTPHFYYLLINQLLPLET